MAELPFHLKRFEPVKGALDTLRYLSEAGDELLDADDLIDLLEISERAFNKSIRRLVTLGYVQMTPEGYYQLTNNGQKSVVELAEYDAAMGGSTPVKTSSKIQRRLVVAVPRSLVAREPASLHIGFHPDGSSRLSSPANVVLRVDALHAEVVGGNDDMMQLGNDAASTTLSLTAGTYDQVRIRVQVLQLSSAGDDVSKCGGLYVDLDVSASGEAGQMTAFSANIELDPA